MFHPSSQHVSFRQQVITLQQNYPCPRCTTGEVKPYGLTETFKCSDCDRTFVPLKGGRLLYPANSIGWKIAPTFWWDGFRWHWAGTTATTRQLVNIVLLSLLPVFLTDAGFYLNLWKGEPAWCNPGLLSPIVGLLSIQMLYLLCWDFDFLVRRKR